MHNRKKQPWLPESSGEYVKTPDPYAYDFAASQRDSELRRRNERVWRSGDGFYRDENDYLRKVTNGPYVSGRQWMWMQKRDSPW
jgi:hypothetical protein